MNLSRTNNASLLLVGALIVGCGDDDGDRGTVSLDMDSSVRDAGSDAQTIDASRDGGADADVDGASIICSFKRSEVAVVSGTNLSVNDPLALAVNNAGASLSWIEYEGDSRTLTTSWFGRDPSSELSPPWDGGTASKAEPSNLATPSGFITVWSDNEGSAEQPIVDVRAQGWSANGQPTAPLNLKLSTDGATTRERTPVLARGADGNLLVVWQNGGQSHGTAQLLDPSGAVVGPPRMIPNFGASSMQPALAALNGRFVLAWVDGVELRVHMVVLDANGIPLGQDVLVDAEANASGTVDLATSAAGGAIVFDVRVAGVRPEVRLRSFDETGALIGNERAVTNAQSTGNSPSIAPLAGGYIVAYRSATSPTMQLQVSLLDYEGTVTGGIAVSPILALDAPVALRIGADGRQMFLSWLDRASGTAAYNLQRTWIRCD